jgi:hypothetical protein
VLRAILTFWAWALALAGLAELAAWAFGRVFTDSLGWSQYLYWIPSPVALAASALALLLSAACGRLARTRIPLPAKPNRTPAAPARLLLVLCWAGAFAFTALFEWHAARYLHAGSPSSAPSMRVLFWNAEAGDLDGLAERVFSRQPDLAIVANTNRMREWDQILATLPPGTSWARSGRFNIVSKFPVLRWGVTDLWIQGVRPRVFTWQGGGNISFDTGEAMFVELDTSPVTKGPIVVWVLDLPSDPRVFRTEMMSQAAGAIAGFSGPVYRRTGSGAGEAIPDAPRGFPAPDLIVGDCNTPRGSASLRELAPEMTDAFAQAGRGFAGTWPRTCPFIAIDQALLGRSLRCRGYRVEDPGAARHRALVVELEGSGA